VPIAEIKPIEAYGVSVFDFDKNNIQNALYNQHEWVLTLSFGSGESGIALDKLKKCLANN